MQKAAFKLVAVVILAQLFMVCAVVAMCTVKMNAECAKGKAQEHFALILTQSLALYASEKGRNSR